MTERIKINITPNPQRINMEVGYAKPWPGMAAIDKFFTHSQQVASSQWNIEHNLNKFPSVAVVDSANNWVMGEIQYINSNNLIIFFTAPFSGKAYLN